MKGFHSLPLLRKMLLLCLLLPAVSAFSQIVLDPSGNQLIPGNSAREEQPVKWTFTKQHLQGDQYKLIFEAVIDSGWHLYAQRVGDGDAVGPYTVFSFEENNAIELVGKVEETGEDIHEMIDEVFNVPVKTFEKRAVFSQLITTKDPDDPITGMIDGQVCQELCMFFTEEFSFGKAVENPNPPPTEPGDQTLLAIFLAGFIGGLIALLTPCVFPMIPMTVSFFTKSSKTKAKGISNAITYGLSIIVIYVLLGFIVTKALGADAMNEMASSAIFNLSFFVIFVVFALSFFGYFEITLPSALVNKMDKASDKGGLIGIFFMAFTLALVSFSCTGPIIGTLLVEAAMKGSTLGPLAGMFGFSLALALPFAVFAAFPGWLNSLPKSGGWLNAVKVVLGFTELALALKFLSNVDLAYHWGFLKREIFIGVWMLISLLTALYVLGVIKFPHDGRVKKFSLPRIGFAAPFLAFTIYLSSGLNGTPLTLISGITPPLFYSIWETETDCPHDINCFKDLDEGIAHARLVKKPILVDFTGHSCASCRKMEESVWIEPDVLKYLKEDYVVISLYVDDKTELPPGQRIPSCTKKIPKTVGNKWSAYQACTFGASTQPYYVLMNTNQQPLNTPVSYTPDKDAYIRFLQEGLEKFNNKDDKLSLK